MTEPTSSRIGEIGSEKKAKRLRQANPRTPKSKQGFGALKNCSKSGPVLEETYTTPVVIPRKRLLLKEAPPVKPRKKKKKRRPSSELEDRFRGRISVKIPAWMKETLKTIPSFPSPKRERELRRQEGVAEGGNEGLTDGVPVLKRDLRRGRISVISDAEENVQVNHNTSPNGICGQVPMENPGRKEIGQSTFSQVCLGNGAVEDVDEDFSCPPQSVAADRIDNEDESRPEPEWDSEHGILHSGDKQDEEIAAEGEAEQIDLDEPRESGESSALNQEAGTSKGNNVATGPEVSISEATAPELEDIQDGGRENSLGSSQPQPPEHLTPEVIVISDDENEHDSGARHIHQPLGRHVPAKVPSAKRASREQPGVNILTPDSLSPKPARAGRHQSSQLHLLGNSPVVGGLTQDTSNRSRWRNPIKGQSRFSGPQIFTPLTLHPLEPGMGLIDQSYYPQHQGLWAKSTQDLLDRFGGLEKAKKR